MYERIGKLCFMVKKTTPFDKWLTQKIGVDGFCKLSHEDRREVFLRWKYGFSSAEANESIEASERGLLVGISTIEDVNQLENGLKFHIVAKVNFHRNADEIWRSIEDNSFFEKGLPQEITQTINMFNGKVM